MATTGEDVIGRQVLAGVAVLRALAWVWLAIVAVAGTPGMRQPVVAWGLIVATGAWAGYALVLARSRPAALVDRRLLVLDVALAGSLLAADGFVHELGRSQSLAGALPLAPVLAVAAVAGRRWVLALAVAFGLARFASAVGLDGDPAFWKGGTWLSVLTSAVLYALAGVVAAGVLDRLRTAEGEVAFARARERVARDLHDGMLQTLAAVQRRADDPDLVHLARSQEAELRAYLFEPGGRATTPVAVDDALRRAAAVATARFGLRVDVALVSPLPALRLEQVEAVTGAVAEALANVAKHAGVDRATIFAEADDAGDLVCSVTDQGRGFDPSTATRRGLAASVEARMAAIGGSSLVSSIAGGGTEVRLAAPTGHRSVRWLAHP